MPNDHDAFAALGLPESMRWKGPEPDPDAEFKAKARAHNNEVLERFFDGLVNETSGPAPALQGVRWEDLRDEAAAAAKAKAEHEASLAHEKQLREEVAASRKREAEMQKQLEKREAQAKVEKIDQYMRDRGLDPRGPERARITGKMARKGLL